MKKAMADMAQELKNIKNNQVENRQEHGDEVESQHRIPRSNEAPSLKINVVQLLRLTGLEDSPAINEGLLERIVEEVQRKISGEYILTSGYDIHRAQKRPFHPDLLREPFPPHYKAPRMEAYTGKSDPNDHIGLFLAILDSQNLPDSILYRSFPSTIRGAAYRWFSEQPAGSITSFSDLTCKFVTQHMGNIHIKKIH